LTFAPVSTERAELEHFAQAVKQGRRLALPGGDEVHNVAGAGGDRALGARRRHNPHRLTERPITMTTAAQALVDCLRREASTMCSASRAR